MIDLLFVTRGLLDDGDNKLDRNLLADYLEDFHSHHKEVDIYINRLRSDKRLRGQTLLDILVKFGNKKCRKRASKIRRRLIDTRDSAGIHTGFGWALKEELTPFLRKRLFPLWF